MNNELATSRGIGLRDVWDPDSLGNGEPPAMIVVATIRVPDDALRGLPRGARAAERAIDLAILELELGFPPSWRAPAERLTLPAGTGRCFKCANVLPLVEKSRVCADCYDPRARVTDARGNPVHRAASEGTVAKVHRGLDPENEYGVSIAAHDARDALRHEDQPWNRRRELGDEWAEKRAFLAGRGWVPEERTGNPVGKPPAIVKEDDATLLVALLDFADLLPAALRGRGGKRLTEREQNDRETVELFLGGRAENGTSPATIKRALPNWKSPRVSKARARFRKSLQITVDEQGNQTPVRGEETNSTRPRRRTT